MDSSPVENTMRPPPRGAAVITGGSSGIGLAAAQLLAAREHPLFLVARRANLLSKAANAIRADCANAQVETIEADVRDAAAMQAAVDHAMKRAGKIDWLIAAAGAIEPGEFLSQSVESHRDQFETNYYGVLNAVVPVARAMSDSGGGRIVMISSGAGLIGIPGYSGYSPSKFAVRGLAECLRAELAPRGIIVTVAYPPDTDTPQLIAEIPLRPMATRIIVEGGGLMLAEAVARHFIRAAESGKFVSAPGWRMGALAVLHSLIGPVLHWRNRRIVLSADRRERE